MSRPHLCIYLSKRAVLVIIAAFLLFGNFIYQYRLLNPSDDYYWLMFISNNYLNRELGTSLYDRHVAYLRESNFPDVAVVRAELRRSMDENYLFQGAFFVPYVKLFQSVDLSVPEKVNWIMYLGFSTSFLLLLALLLFYVARYPDPSLVVAIAAALFVTFWFEQLPRIPRHSHVLPLIGGTGFFEQINNLILLFLRPGPEFTAFSHTPRDRIVLAAVILFLLRWEGKYALAYALIPLFIFLHLEYGGIILITIAAADLVLRPKLVLRSWLTPALGLGGAFYIAGSALAERAGVPRGFWAVPLIIASFGLWIYRMGTKMAATKQLERLRRRVERLRALPAPLQDVLTISLLWLIAVPFLVLGYVITSGTIMPSFSFNFDSFLWLLVLRRAVGLIALVFLIAGMWFLMRACKVTFAWQEASSTSENVPATVSKRAARASVIAAITIVLWGLETAVLHRKAHHAMPWHKSLTETRAIEDRLDRRMSPENWKADEFAVYYAMFVTMLTGQDQLSRLGIPKR